LIKRRESESEAVEDEVINLKTNRALDAYPMANLIWLEG
jgi:hypothetical protein